MTTSGRPAHSEPLSSVADRYDAVLVDLDGVIYRADQAVPNAAGVVDRLRSGGRKLLFLTNNSSRPPDEVAAKLQDLGVHASAEEILTSALATASTLAQDGPEGRTAFVIGEQGIRRALRDAGISVLDGQPDRTDLVIVGWDRKADYDRLRTAALLVQGGARLVATNADASYPAPDGRMWPGAGALLAAVTTTSGAIPMVVGKPNRPMFEAAARITRASHPLMVGDRIDTDVAGAAAMGWDSALVLTGVSRPGDLLLADTLPTYVGDDLRILLRDVPVGRFHPAQPQDAPHVRTMLESAGLADDRVESRIRDTLVCWSSDGASLLATSCLELAGEFGILRSVAVRTGLRGRGVGTLAVAWAIRRARARHVRHVTLFTEGAEAFFGRLGFRQVDRQALPEPVRSSEHAASECAESATPMVLDLAVSR